MDSGLQQRRSEKKLKKKPIKVVYISNPMKVKVNPSGFMALVQELTGQDAELPADLSRFQNRDIIEDDGVLNMSDSDNSSVTKSSGSHESDRSLVMPQVDTNDLQAQLGGNFMEEGFDPFDHTMDDISAFLIPGVFYDPDLVNEDSRRNCTV